ncbi:MAG: class I SAM-dependent methyltransferase [Ferruginibacter sp.]
MDHSKQAAGIFDKLAELYQSKFMDVSAYQQELNNFLDQLPLSSPSILEIACGPGNITRYVIGKRPDLQILGIDLAPGMIALAKKNCPGAEFKVMDCRDIHTLEQKFDGIIVGFCLPYLSLKETTTLIGSISRLLNNKGVLYLSLIEDDQKNSGFRKGSTGDEVFMNYYLAGDIVPIFKKNQLEIVSQTSFAAVHNNQTENELQFICIKQ